MKRFNKIAVIAPDEASGSGIDVDRYSDRVADIFHGYLDPESKAKQIFLMGELVKTETESFAVSALARQSAERMAKRLENEYKIPFDTVVFYENSSLLVDEEYSFEKDIGRYPEFFQEVTAKKRELGLVADELQMPLSRSAFELLKVNCAEFEVRPPMFGRSGSVVAPLIDITAYRDRDAGRPELLAGDI